MENGVNCACFMIHEVNPRTLENLIVTNLREGRMPVLVYNLARVLRGEEKAPADKLFSMSFDDRLMSQWNYAVPLLDKYQTPGTFYAMSPGWPGDRVNRYMTDQNVAQIPDYDEVGDHTINHPTNPSLPQLRRINWGEYAAEISESKRRLEQLTGRKIMTFASPQSFYDTELLKDVASLGYIGAVATYNGDARYYNPIQTNPLQIMRFRIS
jgi:peptidoglycan/xylan/chitin deacetylase (PgdA/CDA1 family)